MARQRKGTKRDPAKEAFWRSQIAAYAGMDVSVREFCETRGLPESSFYAWRTEIGRRDARARALGSKAGAALPAGGIRVASRGTLPSMNSMPSRPSPPAFVPIRLIEEDRFDAIASTGHVGQPGSTLADQRARASEYGEGGGLGQSLTGIIEVVLPAGTTIRLGAGVDRTRLMEVLSALRGSEC